MISLTYILNWRREPVKRRIFLPLFMSCLLLLVPTLTSAHPGRTDANGGHTCKTNCSKWGLETGEYHYHNSGTKSAKKTTKSKSQKSQKSKKVTKKQTKKSTKSTKAVKAKTTKVRK